MEIVDAHLHLWDPSTNQWYPGLAPFEDQIEQATGRRPRFNRTYLPAEYTADAATAGVTVQKYVHVSAVTAPRTYVDELRWVEGVCAAAGIHAVFVGTVDPSLDRAELEAELDAQAGSERFRGVRVLYGLDPEGAAARTLLSWLAERDLVFDLVTQPAAMNAWLRTLAAHPDVRVVLEHTGWPEGLDADAMAAWRTAIGRLAGETNADCKISGLGMATMDLGTAALRPWVEGCVEAFGWDRIAFGSNFPIESMAGDYTTLISSLNAVLPSADAMQRDAFFRHNATRIYRC